MAESQTKAKTTKTTKKRSAKTKTSAKAGVRKLTPNQQRAEARKLYVVDRLPRTTVAKILGVTPATVTRWRMQAKNYGDDWDAARYQYNLSTEAIEATNQVLIGRFLEALTAAMVSVEGADLSPEAKVKALTSLADSYNKMTAAAKKTTPEVAVADVAIQVLQIVHDVVREEAPEIEGAFVRCFDAINTRIQDKFRTSKL